MNFDKIGAIIESETNISICPICGTPYYRQHRRQKTCGTDDCKKEWKSLYQKARTKRLREEDIDAFRKYHADAQRKSRHKKKRASDINGSYKAIEDYWNKERNENVYGLDYGKRSAEKILATVPKIDVNLKGARNDRVDTESNTE